MRKFLRWLGIVATVLLLVSLYTPLWNVLGARLAVPPKIEKADAIVVLGAGLNADHSLDNESLRRAVRGMELFKQGLADVLIVSGPENRALPGKSEAAVRRDLAVQLGMSPDRIRTIDRVNTTRDEARLVASFLGEHQVNRILLVTESMHMRRAAAVFERAGLTVLPAPSDNALEESTPVGRLRLMTSVTEQGAAWLYYRIAGYI